jgi:D-alanyl-D-alanine carboxypeptidase
VTRGTVGKGRWIALAACVLVVAAPATADAKRCRSGQFDRGGTCTSFKAAQRQLAAITRSVMAAHDAKAAIVRIDVGDRTVINRGFGVSMPGVPASPRMNVRVGSMVIPLLTTIALQLQEKHRLDLDDRLSRWYPQYPDADEVTLRMLSNMTAGYPDYIQENPPFQAAQLGDPFRQWSDDDLLRAAFALPQVCAPGACFHYAHTNLILLGRVIEKVTGKSITSLMRSRFVRPLKLRHVRISKLPYIPSPALHAYTSDRGVYEDATTWSPSWGIGKGVMWTSTADDMIKVIKAIGRGRLFSPASMRQFARPYSRGLPAAPPVDDGLGIDTNRSWLFQNPIAVGYQGILGYLPPQKLSVFIETTWGPKAVPESSIATKIHKAITVYLSPKYVVGS